MPRYHPGTAELSFPVRAPMDDVLLFLTGAPLYELQLISECFLGSSTSTRPSLLPIVHDRAAQMFLWSIWYATPLMPLTVFLSFLLHTWKRYCFLSSLCPCVFLLSKIAQLLSSCDIISFLPAVTSFGSRFFANICLCTCYQNSFQWFVIPPLQKLLQKYFFFLPPAGVKSHFSILCSDPLCSYCQ